jgi:hypothetical protein
MPQLQNPSVKSSSSSRSSSSSFSSNPSPIKSAVQSYSQPQSREVVRVSLDFAISELNEIIKQNNIDMEKLQTVVTLLTTIRRIIDH